MEEMTAGELQTAADKLMEAASALELTVSRMAEQQVALAAEAESQVSRIVATVELVANFRGAALEEIGMRVGVIAEAVTARGGFAG